MVILSHMKLRTKDLTSVHPHIPPCSSRNRTHRLQGCQGEIES